jgi:hypothetical protein
MTGSDCCESFFSLNGQWVGNRHNYTYGDMKQNISHMIRLQQIQADPDAPKFARAHIKQENVWGRQFDNIAPPDLAAYPAPGEEVLAWKEGARQAMDLAREVHYYISVHLLLILFYVKSVLVSDKLS